MHYWVVGAMFGGSDDQYDVFMKRGYWFCWDPRLNEEIPSDVKSRFLQIQQGDRIAVKRMLGRGASDMEIRPHAEGPIAWLCCIDSWSLSS